MGKKQKGKSLRLVKKEANKAAQETAQETAQVEAPVEAQVEPSEKECTAAPINIASIFVDYENYQYRSEMSRVSISDYKALILKNVKWHSPIHIGLFNGKHYLLDGFHRIEAYKKLNREEIPAGQWELKEYASEDEMAAYSMKTNLHHGLKLSAKDVHSVLDKLYNSGNTAFRHWGTLSLPIIREKVFDNKITGRKLRTAYMEIKGEDGKTLYQKHSDLRDAYVRLSFDNGTSTVKELVSEFGMSESGIRKILDAGKEKNDPQKLQEEAEQAAKALQEAAEAEEETTLSDSAGEKCAPVSPYHSGLPIITSEAEAEPVSPEEETTLSNSAGEKCAPAEQQAVSSVGAARFNTIKNALVSVGVPEVKAFFIAMHTANSEDPEKVKQLKRKQLEIKRIAREEFSKSQIANSEQ
ncbi:ParB N-terminal domain-containing protein [Aeromonas veronii]|uniref:hypothetical protein n=1 Tax=Aeromonas veronii TaxID=654 RepID=UPI001F1F38C1|nr:hypothetical protein [Aeromonas veronii]MCF5866720.1 hypothetical protein [Aeromonas veronii]